MKINVEQIAAIFKKTADHVANLTFIDIIAYLEGRLKNNVFLVQMLNGEVESVIPQGATAVKVIKTKEDVVAIIEFKETAIFAVRLSLVLGGLTVLKGAHLSQELRDALAKFVPLIQQILDSALDIFKKNDLTVKMSLWDFLQKIRTALYILNDPELTKQIQEHSKKILALCFSSLPEQEVNEKQIVAMRSLFQAGYNLSGVRFTDLCQDFFKYSKRYLQNKEIYGERRMILQEILTIWETLKAELTSDDLQWLKDKVQDLDRQYRHTYFRIQSANAELHAFYARGIYAYRHLLLAMTPPLLVLMLRQMIVCFRRWDADLNVLKEYYKIVTFGTPSDRHLRLLEKAVERIKESFQLSGDILSATLELQRIVDRAKLMTLLFPVLLCAVAVAAIYGTAFFSRPLESRPIVLPEWVEDMLQQKIAQKPSKP